MKKLRCHCGKIEAEIKIDNLDKILRCNCSICKRKGAIMSMVKNENFKITKGEDYINFTLRLLNITFVKFAGFTHITIQDLIPK